LEDVGTDRRRILKMDIKAVGWYDMDWIYLDYYRNLQWAHMNTIMNL
jgi:hypothetical protein